MLAKTLICSLLVCVAATTQPAARTYQLKSAVGQIPKSLRGPDGKWASGEWKEIQAWFVDEFGGERMSAATMTATYTGGKECRASFKGQSFNVFGYRWSVNIAANLSENGDRNMGRARDRQKWTVTGKLVRSTINPAGNKGVATVDIWLEDAEVR